MKDRKTFASDSKWEPLVGYSRAVRVGPHIHVSGTTATDARGEVVDPTDAAAQAALCIQKIAAVLEEAGSSLNDVVRTRMYVSNIDNWPAIGEVHRKVFADISPAATMVEESRYISDQILIEIEADSIVPD